jgi:hypothetical protein
MRVIAIASLLALSLTACGKDSDTHLNAAGQEAKAKVAVNDSPDD